MPTNTYPTKLSQRQVRCSICYGEVPPERRRYCSADCFDKRRQKQTPMFGVGYVSAEELSYLNVAVRRIKMPGKPLPDCYLETAGKLPLAD